MTRSSVSWDSHSTLRGLHRNVVYNYLSNRDTVGATNVESIAYILNTDDRKLSNLSFYLCNLSIVKLWHVVCDIY